MKIKLSYAPQPHQKALHNANSSLIAVTGRQIGKTVCLVNEIIKRSVLVPNSRNWYVTNDYRQAKRNVWDIFKTYCPKEIINKSPNETELKIDLTNGSKIELIGVENAEKLRGAAVNFMGLDEYADFKSGVYEKIFEPMLTTTNGQVWFLGTPKGLGNDFYYKYQHANLMKFRYPSVTLVNENITGVLSKYTSVEKMQEILDKAIKEGTMDWFNQEYLADFVRPAGVVYKEWNIDNYVNLNYDENLPLHLTFDFGVNDPTSIIWIQPKGSETRVIDYYEASNADLNHFIQVINSKPYKTPEFCSGDIAGESRDIASNKSPISILREAGFFVKTSKIPNIPLQVRNTHKRIKNLYIAKGRAERFRDIILNYRYPEANLNLRNQKNEIPIHDEWSHGARAYEYWCWNYDPPEQEITKINKRNTGQDLLDNIEAKRKAREVLSWV